MYNKGHWGTKVTAANRFWQCDKLCTEKSKLKIKIKIIKYYVIITIKIRIELINLVAWDNLFLGTVIL